MKELTVALAGNPNVGKSVIFNQLTGQQQHVGNWPGKTVEKFEGTLNFFGKKIRIIDLPGAYSLSALSQEEEIARDFIKKGKPDVVINIVDASTLEQNLFLTLQLIELGANVVIALNMVDVAKEKGIEIDGEKLSKLLGVPVVPTIATQGKGIEKLMMESINAASRKIGKKRTFPRDITERYRYIHRIVKECQRKTRVGKTMTERLDDILLHRQYGYVFLVLILLLMFFFIFTLGDITSGFTGEIIENAKEKIPVEISSNPLFIFFYKTIAEGIMAGLTIAIPYLIPFYIFLAILEDSGYLPRIAFLADGLMHRIGLHGKAFIPMFLGYGCSVPACLGCRIMESEEQQFLTAFLATMIPCAARSVIILGLVGAYLGFGWAIGIYAFNLIVVFALGFLLSRFVIKKSIGLIMGMPSYKMPSIPSIIKRAWMNVKNYMVIAFPIIIASTFIINALDFFGILEGISDALSPITSSLLGLPSIVGITLIVGFLRKELALILLVALLGTTDLSEALTPLQMVVFTIVSIFYIPCAATVATLVKELGWKRAAIITVFEVCLAILLGAIALRVLPLLGLLG
jgi:ferrous iron transport protein B